MAKVEIYTSAFCPFCYRVKHLLDRKGVAYDEIDVTFSPAKRAEMTAKSGSTSVPQIWIDGQHVGGSDELSDLEIQGRLDDMLGGVA